jgi:polar amino acid transport system substrate-binding protein
MNFGEIEMLKIIGTTIGLLFCGNLFSQETIRLVAGDSFPPLMWKEGPVAKGIAVEIGRAILEKAGYKVSVETCPWARCQLIAENDGAFITGFSKNDERLKKFIFSDVIMYDEVVIVTKKGKEFSFEDTESLKGKKIGAQIGVGFGAKNEGIKKGMIIERDYDDVTRVKKIAHDRIDGGYFSLGEAGIAYSAKMAGYSMKEFSIISGVISKDPNYLATGLKTLKASQKIKKINAAIKALTNDGTISKIQKKNY